MTACLPGAGGRKTSARSTSPSSTVIGTSQSMRIAALHTTARLDRHEGRAHIRATHAMAIRTNEAVADRGGIVPVGARVRPRRASLALRREGRLAYALLTPTLLVILFLVAYPFFTAIVMSLQNKMVGSPGRWIGLANYAELFHDEVFLRTAWNSVVYTVVAVALKFVLGLTMALILDQERRFNNFFRTLLFVPWAVPIVIVSLNWRWIYDDLSGFLNNFLITFHLTSNIISWLSDPGLAMACVIAVVVWAGTPLYSMTFLAGLQAIPRELYEAAEIDGASIVQQFFYVTVPRQPTLQNYARLFDKTPFVKYLRNSTIVAVGNTLASLAFATLGAYALARLRFRGRGLIARGLVFTYLVPPALLDGCTRLGSLFRVILPMSLPALAVVAFFAFTQSWNEFLYANVFVNSVEVRTVTTGLTLFIVEDVFFWGPMMGASFLSALPPLLLYLVFQRWVVKGLTLGGVKG